MRVIRLFMIAHGRRGWTELRWMAAQLDCCERTVRRDLHLLRECGADVEFWGSREVTSRFRLRWAPSDLVALTTRKIA